MQLQDNFSSQPKVMSAGSGIPSASGGLVMSPNSGGRKHNKLLPVVIVLTITTVAGLGFGGYEFWQNRNLQKNDVATTQNSESVETQSQKEAESEQKTEAATTTVSAVNPVIVDTETETQSVWTDTGAYDGYSLSIGIQNGVVSDCQINTLNYYGDMMIPYTKNYGDCSISGISDKIYKVVEVGEGQDSAGDKVAFILETGEIEYFDLSSISSGSNFTIKGKIDPGKDVVDALTIAVGGKGQFVGGYGATVFRLSDGTLERYTQSMLK